MSLKSEVTRLHESSTCAMAGSEPILLLWLTHSCDAMTCGGENQFVAGLLYRPWTGVDPLICRQVSVPAQYFCDHTYGTHKENEIPYTPGSVVYWS